MESDFLAYLAVAAIAFVLGRMSVLRSGGESLETSIEDIDNYITALPDDARNEIETLMRDRKKINAIKLFRQHTGVGLKDAKRAVERMWLS